MKLTIVTNLFPPHVVGGYELGCLGLARAAQSAGHEVRVLSSASIGRLKKREPPTDVKVNYVFSPIYHYESIISGVPVSDSAAAFGGIEPSNVLALQWHLSEFRPDAIWIFNPLGLGPVGILETAVASGIPTTVHLMDHIDQTVIDHQMGFNLSSRWVRAKSKASAIACSQKTLVRNELYGKFRSAAVIANGVPLAERTICAANLPGETLKLVYFGQIERHKGIIQLVEAVKELKNRITTQSLELHLIGSGSRVFQEELKAKIDRCGLTKLTTIHGFCTPLALKEKLKEMHIAVFPLNPNEPFAYVVIEAIDAGLPVVVTREAGCAEFLPIDYPLLLEDRDDIRELAGKLEDFARNPQRILSWIETLKDCVYSNCDLNHICVPRCIEFLTREKTEKTQAEFNLLIDSLLASWQSNRHLNCLIAAPPSTIPVGKRIERWFRRSVSSTIRRKLKLRFRQLLGRAA